MKLLHVISQRPEATGSGIYLQAMIREAARAGHVNALIAGIPRHQVPDLHTLPVQRTDFVTFGGGDLPFQIVGMSDVMPYASGRFMDLSQKELNRYEAAFCRCAGRIIQAFQPDLIHTHHLWIMTSALRKRFPGIPMVCTCHGSDLRQFVNCEHLRNRVTAGCRQLDGICALSRIQAADIGRLYRVESDRITVTGAGFNTGVFHPGPVNSTRNAGEILFAGKLCRTKGLFHLIKAISRINRPGIELHLAGSAPERESMAVKAAVERSGVSAVFHGPLSQESLALQMRSAAVFVLPSFYEGMPLVLLEALASGCRIVTTALPGVRELLEDVDMPWISRIPIPRMTGVDTPLPDDEPQFVENLSHALLTQLDLAQNDIFPLEDTRELLQRYTWPAVFQRSSRVYGEAVKRFKTRISE